MFLAMLESDAAEIEAVYTKGTSLAGWAPWPQPGMSHERLAQHHGGVHTTATLLTLAQ
jgi:hypothetical protein